jgi:hypothetical protein
MNPTRTWARRTALIVRFVVLVAGLACYLCLPWDMPLVAGRVGCLILGLRVWVIGLALLATAAVWLPDGFVENGTTPPAAPGNAVNAPFLTTKTGDIRAMPDESLVTSPDLHHDQDCDADLDEIGGREMNAAGPTLNRIGNYLSTVQPACPTYRY